MATTTTRQEKGQELYRQGKVEFLEGGNPKAGGEFSVGGSGGKSYEVYLDIAYNAASCDCEDFRRHGEGHSCKHIIAAYLERADLMEAER